jgi:UDP-N-acetylmuramyl pentapeptide phosphotransferase/UDP-N-acetylglucosamine-1-phosphate transferase
VYKIVAAYFIVFALTLLGVEFYRRWSLSREILDVPNERSSHSTPTPRGGGVVIWIVSIGAFLIYSAVSGTGFQWAYLFGAGIVAAISLVDDVKTISPVLRILFHSLAAALVVWSLGGFKEILIPFYGVIELGFWGCVAAFLWIVWLINAYNFMDGIDGIAATQAITAGTGWSLVGWQLGISELSFYGGVLAMSALGFLILNWQPAKIFMGDVGSAFLGYSFAVLTLFSLRDRQSAEMQSILPWIGIFLVWFFLFDSVYTLFKRLFRGERIWQAHREHIYQKLVISGLQHRFVTTLYAFGSALIVICVVASLKFALPLTRTVFPSVLVETLLLIIFWRFVARKKKGNPE